MKHSEILSQLEHVVDSTKARHGQSLSLAQVPAEARSKAALGKMQDTIMPRIVRITNDQEDAVTLTVVDGRVADMTDTMMDGVDATPPETTPGHVAQILSMVCSGSGVQFCSAPPDIHNDIAATGLQISEIDAALDRLKPVQSTAAPSEDAASSTAADDTGDPVPKTAPAASAHAPRETTKADMGMAAHFFQRAEKISDQRILIGHDTAAISGPDSVLTQNTEAAQQLMDDLSAWEADSGAQDTGPQLVILRAQDNDKPSLTICRDAGATAMTAHHTRKLGAVVHLWKSLTVKEKFS